MTSVRLDYDAKLREIVEEWEDSLESNHDDFVYVDGEEGDFGIVRYFGTDIDGNKNVHLMTSYIHGGDEEQSFYTPAGAAVVKKLILDNVETQLQNSLDSELDPGQQNGMFIGFMADLKNAQDYVHKNGIHYGGELIQRAGIFFPREILDGAVYKFGFKFYQARWTKPKREGAVPMLYFFNINNRPERLAIKLTPTEKRPNSGLFMTTYESWAQAFNDSRISSVVTDCASFNSHFIAPLGSTK